ncbi:MAG: hypothetical protein RJB63_305 [Actinomycetota bacterium]
MFISALGSITGHSNRLGFKRASKAVVILVDGLGSENLRAAAGHAPFLNAALRDSKSINTVFPSTTAAAITSFGVAAKPAEHGIFGYSVFDRSTGLVRNLLTGWGADFQPSDLQKLPSVSALSVIAGITTFAVGPGEYANSGFTKLNMGEAEYLPARSFDERISAIREILGTKHKSLTYLYFPELDSLAHSHGVSSFEWLSKLEDLDAAIRQIVGNLPKDVGVLLTADHGIVDVPSENQVYLDEIELPGLVAVTGDPRNSFLYFDSATQASAAKTQLEAELDGRCIVATVEELKSAGWFAAEIGNAELLPDLFVISVGSYACYHRGFAKPQSLRMIGQHGGISQAELSVPLLKFGAFAD